MMFVSTNRRGPVGSRKPDGEEGVDVDDVDEVVSSLRAQGMTILREAADMPWGERLAYVTDPEGNPWRSPALSASPHRVRLDLQPCPFD